MMKNDVYWMKKALQEAQKAEAKDEVPVGCVIVKDGKLLSRGHNLRETTQSVIAHAEMIAIEKAQKKVKNWRLIDCDVYVTLEPCAMCAGALYQAKVRRVCFATRDPKGGAVVSSIALFDLPSINHHPEVVEGVEQEKASLMLKEYFKKKRK